MSLITRCPVCQTLFKVVPDQLRISDGWARCGSCEAIFDASLHLLADTVEADPAANLDTDPEPLTASDHNIGDVPDASQLPNDQTLPPGPDSAANYAPSPSAEPDVATFLNIDPATARPRNPLRRFALGLLSFGLLFGLVGQVTLHERDRIAALLPALRPWLVALCLPLKCQVSPLRQRDAIAIDRASFSKIAGNSYRLNFSVKNKAAVPVAAQPCSPPF